MTTPATYTPTEADKKHADLALETAQLQAKSYLPILLNRLVERGLDPTAPAKQLLETAEYAYKLSGLAKRQEEVAKGPSFQVRIVLPGKNREITIGGGTAAPNPVTDAQEGTQEALQASTEPQVLAGPPEHVSGAMHAFPNDLDLSLDFDDE